MWSDNETKTDLLNFTHLLAVAKLLIENKNLLPATIGIFGDWGSGKTSLMKMLEASFADKEEEGILCVLFNGWLFEGYEDTKTALLDTILSEVEKRKSESFSDKAKALFRSLRKRVNLMRLSLTAVKYATAYGAAGWQGVGAISMSDLPQAIKQVAEVAKTSDVNKLLAYINDNPPKDEEDTTSLREFHRDFAELLKETDIETLVVFIDDLDRCTPDTIIGTLEAIKLFLFAPQTAFVIGADEDLVRYAVRRRFPEIQSDKTDVGRDYLEKLIQFPIRIPPLSQVELEAYIHLLFVELAKLAPEKLEEVRQAVIGRIPEHLYDIAFARRAIDDVLVDIGDDLRSNLALVRQISPLLTRGLSGNPRQTKRFLNSLMMRQTMAEARSVKLNSQILAKLMLLEYIKLPIFLDLAELQATQEGKPIELTIIEAEQMGAVNAQQQEADGEEEEPNSNEADASAADSQYVSSWLSDDWIKEWLLIEPRLGDIDLRPYFYFSRDQLTSLTASTRRLSPRAQTILANLTSESQIARRRVASDISKLNEAEASQIFTLLSDRGYQRAKLTGKDDELDSLAWLVKSRPELQGQLFTWLARIPPDAIALSIPNKLEEVLGKEPINKFGKQLYQSWSTSDNKGLAASTKQALTRLTQNDK